MDHCWYISILKSTVQNIDIDIIANSRASWRRVRIHLFSLSMLPEIYCTWYLSGIISTVTYMIRLLSCRSCINSYRPQRLSLFLPRNTLAPVFEPASLRFVLFSSFTPVMSDSTFYSLKAELPLGKSYDFANLKGKTVLIVNTASNWCVLLLNSIPMRVAWLELTVHSVVSRLSILVNQRCRLWNSYWSNTLITSPPEIVWEVQRPELWDHWLSM